MSLRFLMLMGVLANPALAADPDHKRPVPEGEVRYVGERLEAGATAHAFLIRYEDNTQVFVSSSRYTTDFEAASFRFRNSDAHPFDEMGTWVEISFTVRTVSETAVESPAGSNNWTWQVTYECDLVSVRATG